VTRKIWLVLAVLAAFGAIVLEPSIASAARGSGGGSSHGFSAGTVRANSSRSTLATRRTVRRDLGRTSRQHRSVSVSGKRGPTDASSTKPREPGSRVGGGDGKPGDNPPPRRPRGPGLDPGLGVIGTTPITPVTPIGNIAGGPAGPIIPARAVAQQAPARVGFFPPPPGETRYVSNEVVVDLAPRIRGLNEIARRHRLTHLESHRLPVTGRTIQRWRINDGRPVSTVIRSLARDVRIAGAQPNYLFRLEAEDGAVAAEEGDPAQYMVAKLHLPAAHQLATGNNVLVAVIDSGIDAAHPDLAGAIAARLDALGGGQDPHFHGTAMAGAIAARGRLIGVAPRVRLLAVRAMNASGEGTSVSIATGLDWAIGRGARIINMSFAGAHDPLLEQHFAVARRRHIVLVAAAGNAGPQSAPLYPAADPNVIAVTATDATDQLFAPANRGRHIALAAPGVDILVPAPNASVQLISGTSIAAAHVSGVAALLIERSPGLSPQDVLRVLTGTAAKLEAAKPEDTGAGLADAYGAINSARQAPIVQVSSPPAR